MKLNYLERARHVLSIEKKEIERLSERLDDNFGHAIEMIQQTLDARGKIIVLGVGKSGHIGEKIAATLTSTGAPTVVLNSLNALHGDLGVVANGDIILLLSYSGETDELLNILPALARFDARRIALTGNLNSTLARSSDLVLDASVSQEACPHNLAPTSSTTVMLALGDALAMVLLESRGFTRENFAQFHPGGQLGRSLLLRARDIMRTADQVAVVAKTRRVVEVLQELTAKRAGAALVIEENGTLAGIFTHSDFARHFLKNRDIGEQIVGDLMTVNPVTIAADKLATEALLVLEQHHIDDLVVTNDTGKPLGVIDSQDLSRLKLL